MARYIGEFRLSKSDHLLYYYADGPYKDVLPFLQQLAQAEPKYIRSSRAWTVPLPKVSKKAFQQEIENQGWECEIL